MNAEIYGTANLTFTLPTEHKTKELAYYNAGFKIDNDSVAFVELVVTNHRGERTILRVPEWDFQQEEMFDENGLPVE